MLTKRSTCRLCLSPDVAMIYAMPECPPVDNYRLEHEKDINLPAFPMDLYMCKTCGHAQLLDIVDPNILFGNYIYTSSSSPDLDKHFSAYADKIAAYAQLSSSSLVIDIGSNDGLLLSKFAQKGIKVLGIDPASTPAQQAIAKGIPTIIDFIGAAACEKARQTAGLADVVCANNVFSHSDDLIGFAKHIKSLLKPDGIFVFEVSYLKDLVDHKVIDYVYHEHLAHHSIRPFKLFFESIGMKIFDVEHVPVKGGSIRGYATHQSARWEIRPIIAQMIESEIKAGLYAPETYQRLKAEMDAIGAKSRQILEKTIASGNKAASYGASATATVLNHMFDINSFFSFIVDDNPTRQGRLSPGFKIPVKAKTELLSSMPAVTFISSWRFADMIVERNKAYLEAGGQFIIPLPEFRIVKLG